jgi:predicted nucleic acid-binding protein
MSFGVVLDACVLIPMTLRDVLLRAADAGLYRPRWIDTILDEVRRNLLAAGVPSEEKAQKLVDTIAYYFPEATITEDYESIIDAMTNDPKDRHVLAAAVVSGSHLIVTENLRHFPDAALARFGVQAQAPDAFLVDLFDLAPARMVEIIKELAADRKNPPGTAHQVLDGLAKRTPTFAQLVRERLFG